jgi:hypothetical protein
LFGQIILVTHILHQLIILGTLFIDIAMDTEIICERLVQLIMEQGPYGILSSELPKRYVSNPALLKTCVTLLKVFGCVW